MKHDSKTFVDSGVHHRRRRAQVRGVRRLVEWRGPELQIRNRKFCVCAGRKSRGMHGSLPYDGELRGIQLERRQVWRHGSEDDQEWRQRRRRQQNDVLWRHGST